MKNEKRFPRFPWPLVPQIPEQVSKLGKDPEQRLRTSLHAPVGLTNLGATCYMNAVLQMMYHVQPFRQGIFDLTGPVTNDPLVGQTRRVFAEMHAGPFQVVDTTPFSNTLGVKLDVQQDGSEFQGFFLHGHGGLGSRLESHGGGQLCKVRTRQFGAYRVARQREAAGREALSHLVPFFMSMRCRFDVDSMLT